MDEGATLSTTLFPYLNKVCDYRFLDVEFKFIAHSFLTTLVTHVKDNKEVSFEAGFVLYGMSLNPKELHGIFNDM